MPKSLKDKILEYIEQGKPEETTTYSIIERFYKENKGNIPRAKIGKALEAMENHDLEKKWKDKADGGFWYYKKI